MVSTPGRVPSFITDEDERLLALLHVDTQARQLLRCYVDLPAEARREVSRVAVACRDARPTLVALPATSTELRLAR